jgi:tetratricopeptide (TPR) repeat protein
MLRKLTLLTAILGLALLLLAAAPDPQKNKHKGGGKGHKQGNGQQGDGQGGDQKTPPAGGDKTPPPPAPPEVGRAEHSLLQYKTGEARSALSPVADQADTNPAVSVALGRVLEQEKKYGDAADRLHKAADLAPADPAPYVYLGETYLHSRSGDPDSAFRKAADLAQGTGNDYYLGVAQQRLHQFDQAISTLQRARSNDPGNALIPYQIGVTRVFQENWSDAVDQLSKALDMDSGLAYAYYYRGLAAEKIGRKDLLVNDMERFVTLAPNAPEADRAKAVLRAAKQ